MTEWVVLSSALVVGALIAVFLPRARMVNTRPRPSGERPRLRPPLKEPDPLVPSPEWLNLPREELRRRLDALYLSIDESSSTDRPREES